MLQMQKRIQKQFQQCSQYEQIYIKRIWTVQKINGELRNWLVKIKGQHNTPFAGGIFKLQINLHDKYPHKFPQFKFITKIYHPNINPENGQICEQMIGKNHWLPTKKIKQVIETIYGMMKAPNIDFPINQQAAKNYKQGKYAKIALQWTNKYAK